MDNERYECDDIEGFDIWDEEEEKSFACRRDVCRNFSLVLHAERKPLEWSFFVLRHVPMYAVAAVV